MARRRSNSEGTIYESPEGSGIWYAQLPPGLDGKRPKRRAATQREALVKLRELQRERDQGVNLSAKQPTVAEWCVTWLETFALNLKPNVKEDYAGVIKRYIAHAPIGRRRLDKLTPAEIQNWANDLSQHLAPQTVRNAHARLHKALEIAVRNSYISRNAAHGTELPPIPKADIYPLDFHQSLVLLDAVEGHRWAALYRLAINLGMRQGELLGLTWEAINFEAGTIRIFRQLRRIKADPDKPGVLVLQSVKTKAGERTLRIDDDLIAVLRAHRANQMQERLLCGAKWKDKWGMVFVTETGAPVSPSCLFKHFKKVLKDTELGDIRFHDLRHTAATLLLADSVPLVTVSKILGHSSPAVTATIYAHALDDYKAGAIASLSKRLRRA